MVQTIYQCFAIAGLGVAYRAKPLVRQNANQAISSVGLDGVLYLLGMHDKDLNRANLWISFKHFRVALFMK